MEKEQHPYLHHFNSDAPQKFLIIGTFPPNKTERVGKASLTNLFYRSNGAFWSILDETGFFAGNSLSVFERLQKD